MIAHRLTPTLEEVDARIGAGLPLDEANERWLPIVGHEGYEVSDHGRVRSWWVQGRSWLAERPRILALAYRKGKDAGRCSTALRVPPQPENRSRAGGKRVWVQVAWLVLEAFVGPCPPGMEACHGDRNPANNRLDNLRWATHAENESDKRTHGTNPAGERNGMSKLTWGAAREIRRARERGAKVPALARAHGVSVQAVCDVINGKRWREGGA